MNNNLRHISLLNDVRRATTYWFLSKKTISTIDINDECFQLLVTTCVAILQNGFKLSDTTNASIDVCKTNELSYLCHANLQRLIDDFVSLNCLEHIGMPVKNFITNSPTNANEFFHTWTSQCLLGGCLSRCLQALISEQELLKGYYNATGFLRQNNYATAMLLCLTAVELNQYSLLSQLDIEMSTMNGYKLHILQRRTSSHPNISLLQEQKDKPKQKQKRQTTTLKSTFNFAAITQRQINCKRVHFRRVKSLPIIANRHNTASIYYKPIKNTNSRRRCKTFSQRYNYDKQISPTSTDDDELNILPSTSAGSKRSHTSNNSNTSCSSSIAATNSTSDSQHIELINCDSIKIWTDQSLDDTLSTTKTSSSNARAQCVPKNKHKQSIQKKSSPLQGFLVNLFGTPPTYTSWAQNYTKTYTTADAGDCCENDNITSSVLDTFLPVNGKKLNKRRAASLFQDDGISMLDYTTPTTTHNLNQTLTAVSEPLDIVNADGIDADYGMKSNAASTLSYDSSTASTATHSQQKYETQQSLTAFLQMARYSRSNNNTELEKENAHFRISEVCITAIEHVKWAAAQQQQSSTTTSANTLNNSCHEALHLPTTDANNVTLANEALPYAVVPCSDLHCAESVGLQLISKFNDQQLPKLTDLKWLVSEEDAPQQLLPMPASYEAQKQTPTRHHETGLDDFASPMTTTRGNKYWAPPRQQIIFTEHPIPNRMKLLHKQHYLCAGCGMRVSKQYVQHFRYCTYLGKYHCTGCHRNQISAIPAKILQNWDFKCYPVSVFAYRLIEQMYTFPLFHVPDLNPLLYVKHKNLYTARQRRIQLKYIKNFIKLCRFATKEQLYFDGIPEHITADPDLWSMCDFVDVQNCSMKHSIDELIMRCEEHIFNCVLCTGRGFVCECCNAQQVIYPWQHKVVRCTDCGTCYHQNCWNYMQSKPSTGAHTCCRCIRLQNRKN